MNDKYTASAKIDVTLLRTVNQARNLMDNALKHGRMDVYQDAFRRLCEIEGKDHDDPVVLGFWQAVAAVEQILFEKHGRIVRAARTRQKAAKVGETACLTDWALGEQETEGFELLVGKGLADKAGEYIVVKNSDRFAPEVVAAAKKRLAKHGISLPE